MADTKANPYSRIIAAEVWNFMSIEHGRVEFDEQNIINLKGYNDSGKSGILTALKVALLNANPSKQASFIQDDKEYFRIVVYFDDGVQLLRDKYINGQSLYELHKDGQCIYTTKSGKALTRITDVPEPIAEYLGLVTFDGGALNARSCFEKQLGVQTTGAENYKMFNTVLKSEEIATAGALLNNDKNRLAADINAVDAEIQAQRTLLAGGEKVTEGMIDWLKSHDAVLDAYEAEYTKADGIKALATQLEGVVVYPVVGSVDMRQLQAVVSISGVVNELAGVRVMPEVSSVDGKELAALAWIQDISNQLAEAKVAPEVGKVDNAQIDALLGLMTVISNSQSVAEQLAETERNLSEASATLEDLQKQAEEQGRKMVKCPNCGELFDPELMHAHA